MCGIVGYIDPAGAVPDVAAKTRRMMRVLERRGPDAEGLESWPGAVLGHRRLSIFDLSELGRQPMLSPDRAVGVVFNGAIYNWRDLRHELEQKGFAFKSESDTEVLLHGYEAWGMDKLVERLRGMFAIGLWDSRMGKLYLLRDRLGVKPLVYAVKGSQVAFASTVRALEESGLAGELDPEAVSEYFEHGYVTDQRTIFRDINKVPAATLMEFSGGTVRQREYWHPTTARPAGVIAFDEAVEETERRFLDAVRLRLDADVPVGALLSGGVDSSLVCWAIAKLGGDIEAFTIGAPGDEWDETDDAVQTARELGIRHHVIPLAGDQAPEIDELIDAYGEPFACASALGMLRISRAIKPSATVLLTGDGGDDCFLGYPEHKNLYLAQRLAQRTPRALSRLWRVADEQRLHLPRPLRRLAHLLDFVNGGLGAVTRIHDGLPYYRRNGLFGPRLAQATIEHREIPPSLDSARRLLDEFLVHDRHNRFTGEYLTKVDGGSMYHALEARSPFLDQDLWNWAHALPYDTRLHQGNLKAVLREIARRRIGPRVSEGRKRGFGIPVQRWLVNEWRRPMEDLLSRSVAAAEGWIDASAARASLERASQQGEAPKQLWYIFVFEEWLRRHRERTAAPEPAPIA